MRASMNASRTAPAQACSEGDEDPGRAPTPVGSLHESDGERSDGHDQQQSAPKVRGSCFNAAHPDEDPKVTAKGTSQAAEREDREPEQERLFDAVAIGQPASRDE